MNFIVGMKVNLQNVKVTCQGRGVRVVISVTIDTHLWIIRL